MGKIIRVHFTSLCCHAGNRDFWVLTCGGGPARSRTGRHHSYELPCGKWHVLGLSWSRAWELFKKIYIANQVFYTLIVYWRGSSLWHVPHDRILMLISSNSCLIWFFSWVCALTYFVLRIASSFRSLMPIVSSSVWSERTVGSETHHLEPPLRNCHLAAYASPSLSFWSVYGISLSIRYLWPCLSTSTKWYLTMKIWLECALKILRLCHGGHFDMGLDCLGISWKNQQAEADRIVQRVWPSDGSQKPLIRSHRGRVASRKPTQSKSLFYLSPSEYETWVW